MRSSAKRVCPIGCQQKYMPAWHLFRLFDGPKLGLMLRFKVVVIIHRAATLFVRTASFVLCSCALRQSLPFSYKLRNARRTDGDPNRDSCKIQIRTVYAESCNCGWTRLAEISFPSFLELNERRYCRPSQTQGRVLVCVCTIFVPRAKHQGSCLTVSASGINTGFLRAANAFC